MCNIHAKKRLHFYGDKVDFINNLVINDLLLINYWARDDVAAPLICE